MSIDPSRCECGPATPAVREILTEVAAIDWFEPVASLAEARRRFDEHHRSARAREPELFPALLEIQQVRGGPTEFAELCERVRTNHDWDWRFSVLKPLSHRHAKALDWSLETAALEVPEFDPERGPDPNNLFMRFQQTRFWTDLGPKLEPTRASESQHWYFNYARMDVLECMQWQLAERSVQLDQNPFLPLLRCYAAGGYPFSLGPEQVVLFGFA